MRLRSFAFFYFMFLFFNGAGIVFGQTSSNLLTPAPPQAPMDGDARIKWILTSTIGPASLWSGGVSAGWGTLLDKPKEYGTHWDGFGKRYGMRFTGIATSNVMEAGLGALWGEDPRYVRDAGHPFKNRLGYTVKMTFFARRRDGEIEPAYARYIAISGSNFLSNTWRPDSDATIARASARTALGFLGRFSSNLWDEFWPDIRPHIFHFGHKDSTQQSEKNQH